MKKIIYIFAIITLLSCTPNAVNERGEIILTSNNKFDYDIHYVEFNKHRYIRCYDGHGLALTHDPDCPHCESKKYENKEWDIQ